MPIQQKGHGGKSGRHADSHRRGVAPFTRCSPPVTRGGVAESARTSWLRSSPASSRSSPAYRREARAAEEEAVADLFAVLLVGEREEFQRVLGRLRSLVALISPGAHWGRRKLLRDDYRSDPGNLLRNQSN
jgi:hypothetical protein